MAGRVRVDIREKGLWGEGVYDQATWRCISSCIDCGERKCTTEPHGGVYRQTLTVGRGSVRPSHMEVYIVKHWLWGEEVYDRATWRCISSCIDCGERKCTTEPHGGAYHHALTVGRGSVQPSYMEVYIIMHWLWGEEVYDRATWRCISSNIDCGERECTNEPHEGVYRHASTVGRGSVRPSHMEVYIVMHRLWGEEVYDRATWRCISSCIDCRGRKCATEPHGGVYRHASTVGRGRVRPSHMEVYIVKHWLWGEEVYDQATWRCISSCIDCGERKCTTELHGGVYHHALTVGRGSVQPSYMEAYIVMHWLWGEEVYDRATWRCISSCIDCRERKCTTELHGGVYRHASTVGRGRVRPSHMEVYIVKHWLWGEEVYDQATWRCISSCIDCGERKCTTELHGGVYHHALTVGRGSVQPSYMEAYIVMHWLRGEEVYDRATWRCISSCIDCRERKCTTELHGGVYHHASTVGRGSVRPSYMEVYIVIHWLWGEEVYDRATWRCISSCIDCGERKCTTEPHGGVYRHASTVGGGSVRPSYMKVYIVMHWLWGEEVYDRATWRCISSCIDCGERKCTTEPHGGVYRQTLTVGRESVRPSHMEVYIVMHWLWGEGVYDRATWRCILSCIDCGERECTTEPHGGVYRHTSTVGRGSVRPSYMEVYEGEEGLCCTCLLLDQFLGLLPLFVIPAGLTATTMCVDLVGWLQVNAEHDGVVAKHLGERGARCANVRLAEVLQRQPVTLCAHRVYSVNDITFESVWYYVEYRSKESSLLWHLTWIRSLTELCSRASWNFVGQPHKCLENVRGIAFHESSVTIPPCL